MTETNPDVGTPEWDAKIARLRASEQPILADLEAAGHPVSSIWLFKGSPDAAPILITHLERGGYPERVMEGLGSAIARSNPGPYWDRLMVLYRNARSEDEAEGLVSALAEAATAERESDLCALLTDPTLGDERGLLIDPLLRVGGERGREAVQSLVDHPALGYEAARSLASQNSNRRKRFDSARVRLNTAVAARPQPVLDADAVEWSTSFDLPDWKWFATFLRKKLGGELAGPLGKALFTVIGAAPSDDEDHILVNTDLGVVRIGWFIDDIDTIDAYIFGSQQVHDLSDAWYQSNIDG